MSKLYPEIHFTMGNKFCIALAKLVVPDDLYIDLVQSFYYFNPYKWFALIPFDNKYYVRGYDVVERFENLKDAADFVANKKVTDN